MSDIFKNILNDGEKSAIQRIADDKISMSALKKVLLYQVYYQGVLDKGEVPETQRNFTIALALSREGLTDEQLGQDLRGITKGLVFVESGFKELKKFASKPEKEDKEKVNEAR